MTHLFDTEEAVKYGIDEAILLYNIRFWLLKNIANNHHYIDGQYWTYNSAKAFVELFPYWNNRQIERIVKSLREKKAIVAEAKNEDQRDRTLWYSITDLHLQKNVETFTEKCKRDLQKNVNVYKVTDNKLQIINTDINIGEIFEKKENLEISEKKPQTKSEKKESEFTKESLEKILKNAGLENCIAEFVEFAEHRNKLKKPISSLGMQKLANKLAKMQKDGINIKEAIERSIINNWQDVYLPKKENQTSDQKAKESEYISNIIEKIPHFDILKATKYGIKEKVDGRSVKVEFKNRKYVYSFIDDLSTTKKQKAT